MISSGGSGISSAEETDSGGRDDEEDEKKSSCGSEATLQPQQAEIIIIIAESQNKLFFIACPPSKILPKFFYNRVVNAVNIAFFARGTCAVAEEYNSAGSFRVIEQTGNCAVCVSLMTV